MNITSPKKIHNPTPPEYANVHILRWIMIFVGFICLAVTGYATWSVYTLSNRIGVYELTVEVGPISSRVTPINFDKYERVVAIDKEKKSFMLTPTTRDPFYARTITSTLPLAPLTSSTPLFTPTSTDETLTTSSSEESLL
jgi:hypothetical protein